MVGFPHVFFTGVFHHWVSRSPPWLRRVFRAPQDPREPRDRERDRDATRAMASAEDLVMLLVSVWKITEVYGNICL
jgi:hypothetical protein